MFCFLLVRFFHTHGAGRTGVVRTRRCTVTFVVCDVWMLVMKFGRR